jgi:azurin
MNQYANRAGLIVGCLSLLTISWFVAAQQRTPNDNRAADLTTPGRLELNESDHVAIIGNALADRMQHHNHLETLIHAKFPKHGLVLRNLAVAGDEVAFRHRSENFGSPDEWLGKTKADVVFAFFGFNESFRGREGLDKFKRDLDQFLKETAKKNYGGKGNARLVLFSPIAAEKHIDPNYPDPKPINENLRLYTGAMAEVAKANGVKFVDLFTNSQWLYDDAAKQRKNLTIDGLHLGEAGDRALAPEIFRALFNESAPGGDLVKLRAAVAEKNYQWHQRYRTIDGYNVYGGRSLLAFDSKGQKITNRHVMQEEMSQRDVLTANRDRRVWAVAQGKDVVVVDDSNLPPVTEVDTNKPGPLPDKSHVFLGGEEAISKMKVHPGLKVNLFASEEQFPELINPVQMAWDTRGRLWVAVWPNYPERRPTSKTGDSLLIFEDTNGDGKADKCIHFLDNLNGPTGFQFYKDGVLLMQAPDLWFVRDTNGDDEPDSIERILMGLDSADSHHTTNAMALDPGGATYLSDGVFHRTQVETEFGPVRNNDAAIYRYEPHTNRFETYVSYGFANPHGRVFDAWGNDLITDATGNNTYFGAAFSGHIDYPQKHRSLKQFWERPSRPCPHTGLLTSKHFPDEFWNNFLNLNVISFQGVFRVKIREEGSGLWGETLPDLISSTDQNFRPICISTGHDGAIYFADWSNAIIGHMQHHLRDPNRDDEHGRIYRITAEGRPLNKPHKIYGQPIDALLPLLKEPENQVREWAKIELGKHDGSKVAAAVQKWAESLDRNDSEYEHHMMEALWVHQWHNVVNEGLLNRMLKSPEPRARAAAARVLCYWRDRVPHALATFKTLATDENPRVRLEGVRAASFFRTPEAVDVALAALNYPLDYYLEYTLGETMRQLEPYWRRAIAENKPVADGNPAGLTYLIKSMKSSELLKLPRSLPVSEALLLRPDVPDANRGEVLNALAEARKTTRAAVVLDMMKRAESDAAASATLARLLPLQPPVDLQPQRDNLYTLMKGSSNSDVRSSAWAAMAMADNTFDNVWSEASKSPAALAELLWGIPTIYDPDIRSLAYDKVKPLLTSRGATPTKSAPIKGRYVRIELPRKGTLTLAEVQVMSNGRNVAQSGRARQSSTAHSGAASRAIDGNTDGNYGNGGQSHTREDESNPWWEVDLGREFPIDSVVVWNRTDDNGRYVPRLDGFTVVVRDDKRMEVFSKAGIPAPKQSGTLAVGSDAQGAVRRAAIAAAVSMNTGQETTFNALAQLIKAKDEIVAAARGIRTLPRNTWPKGEAGELAKSLVAWAKSIPGSERTSQDYLETVQFAGELANLLPAEEARRVRGELKAVRVPIFVIMTVREQMRYDTPRLVVEPGKNFEIILENTDFMPHNLVIVNPGTRQKIGEMAAEMLSDQLDAFGRAYIPATHDILAATKLLENGQRQTLKVVAPDKEGVYDYVCTYPGHWELMWGRLIVTKDVDAYLEANPDATPPKATNAKSGHEHH